MLFRSLPFFAAAALALEPFLLFQKSSDGWAWAFLSGFFAFFAYFLDRKRLDWAFFAFSVGLVAVAFWVEKARLVAFDLAFCGLLFWFYDRPEKGPTLRKNGLLKPISIATVWAVLSIKIPLDLLAEPFVFALFAERFCFVAALAVGWDASDFERDEADGLATLAVRFGLFSAKNFALAAVGAAVFLSFLLFGKGVFSAPVLVAALAVDAAAAFFIQKIDGKRPARAEKFRLDALLVLRGAAVGAAAFLG